MSSYFYDALSLTGKSVFRKAVSWSRFPEESFEIHCPSHLSGQLSANFFIVRRPPARVCWLVEQSVKGSAVRRQSEKDKWHHVVPVFPPKSAYKRHVFNEHKKRADHLPDERFALISPDVIAGTQRGDAKSNTAYF